LCERTISPVYIPLSIPCAGIPDTTQDMAGKNTGSAGEGIPDENEDSSSGPVYRRVDEFLSSTIRGAGFPFFHHKNLHFRSCGAGNVTVLRMIPPHVDPDRASVSQALSSEDRYRSRMTDFGEEDHGSVPHSRSRPATSGSPSMGSRERPPAMLVYRAIRSGTGKKVVPGKIYRMDGEGFGTFRASEVPPAASE
jgi:hypothetical protein